MLIFPEIELIKTIRALLVGLEKDYENSLTPQDSFLYSLLGNITYGRFNLFDEAVSIFVKKDDDPRKIHVTPTFNIEKQQVPSIHLNMPSEQPGFTDGIGISPGSFFDGEKMIETYQRGFTSSYSIVIVSDNRLELLVIHTVLKMLLIQSFDHLQISGIENPSVSSADLRLYDQISPKHLFMRAININCSHVQKINKKSFESFLKFIIFEGFLEGKQDSSFSISL